MSSFSFLLVDDEKEFVETVTRRLRQRGYTANFVLSGTEALHRLEMDDTVDVVVLDVGISDPDGIKTLATLKKKNPLVEVIMLTDHETVHSAVEAIKSGAFDYLTKPWDLNDLIYKATQAVSRKKEREAKILDIRNKPYISKRERDELISHILDSNELLSVT